MARLRPIRIVVMPVLYWLVAFVFLLAAVAPAYAAAQTEAAENQLKAAYLYRFGGYVEWPTQAFPHAESPFVIGLVGADAVADELARIVARRTIAGRPVLVKKLGDEDLAEPVNMLFIGRTANAQMNEILSAVRGRPILIVTESDNALNKGSMINFQVIDDRMRFEVAPGTAEKNALKISSRMLSVAYQVAK